MQIWKSSYAFVFMQKQYRENFAFFARKVCKFLKKLANF